MRCRHTTHTIYQKFGMMRLMSHTGQCLLSEVTTDISRPVTPILYTVRRTVTKTPSLDYRRTGESRCGKVTGQFLPLHILSSCGRFRRLKNKNSLKNGLCTYFAIVINSLHSKKSQLPTIAIVKQSQAYYLVPSLTSELTIRSVMSCVNTRVSRINNSVKTHTQGAIATATKL